MQSSSSLQVDARDINYTTSEKLGWGTYSSVYKGTLARAETSIPVAVKITNLKKHDFDYCQHEMEILALLTESKTPNVTYLDGYCVSELEFEYRLCIKLAEYGSLNKHLGTLENHEQESIMLDVTNAVYHLHELDVIHCDIKPGNILLGKNKTAMLGDFGDAAGTEENDKRKKGTPLFHAPEQVINDSPHTKKTDIYSLGLTLFCIENKSDDPYTMIKESNTEKKLATIKLSFEYGRRMSLKNVKSDSRRNAITESLKHEPEKRGTAGKVLSLLR